MKSFPWKDLKLNKFYTKNKVKIYYHYQKALCSNKKGMIVACLAWNMSPDVYSTLLITNKKIRKYYDFYIIIMRGYKSNIDYGNNLTNISNEVYNFIKCKKIEKFIIMGHSIGVAIWWRYILTYGDKQIEKFILVDEMTRLLQNDNDSAEQNLNLGSIIPQCDIYNSYNILIKGNEEAKLHRENIILSQFSDNFKMEHPDIIQKILLKVNLYSYNSTANILFSNIPQNWINNLLINKIKIPTFLFGGKNSVVPYQSIIYQKQYYNNVRIYIFEGDNSSHFAFLENYKEFNKLLNKFI
jgi:pimeloyl-ACP methyl ester carboxylesterase